jgi:pimeloyl-ACP methyl ester carboxylesterase
MQCLVMGVTINYEIKGSGLPVVFLHGLGVDHRSLDGYVEPLFGPSAIQDPSGEYMRIYLDLPGMGLSEAAPGISNTDQMLALISGFIDEIIPDCQFALFGYSYGGYLARGLIHQRSEDIVGVCLLCPVVFAEQDKRQLPAHKPLLIDKPFLETLEPSQKESFESIAIVQNQASWEKTQRFILPGRACADQSFIERLSANGYGYSFDIDEHCAPFSKPSLIVSGNQDAIVGYQDVWLLQQRFSRSTFATLDMAGHRLAVENEPLLQLLVSDWLSRVSDSLTKEQGY